MSIVRRVSLLAAMVLAWAWAGNDRAPLTLTLMSEASAAQQRADDALPGKGSYELSAVKVLSRVIIHVRENYVDPHRVKPREMLVAGLEAVEKTVPDVMVEPNADNTKVKVVANGQMREFDLTPVDSLWRLSTVMREVFSFLSKNMRPVEDPREVEYAAVNGMLQTLDPHSVLMKPDLYRDMKTATKGEFGGLGFVIQMREGVLTVVKVLPKTPAFRAGIKKDDQITRIGEESTVNMDVNEAVSKLRGPVDTKVTITINRKSWDKPQQMTLTRALISIESVQSKLLAKQVGYVRVKNFQGNTTNDLHTALDDLEAQAKAQGNAAGLKGLVLDLRGNPGGLLDQAIQVSDTFLSAGTIVSTVGLSDRLRDEKKAHPDDRDDLWPIAVLVNAGSASASEIVAGALKNQDRAVIIGRQSFGKGSVQVLYDFPDDSALKLTIAKYLTPGDVSIQEVGITPDIQLVPTLVSKDRVDVFSPRKTMGEADLEHHFSNPANAQAAKKRDDVVIREKPSESLKYLKEEKEKKVAVVAKPDEKKDVKGEKDAKKPGKNVMTDAEHPEEELDDQLDAEAQDEVKEDFEVQFARDFLLQAPFTERKRMLAAGKAFVAEKRRQEEERIAQAITGLGIDWTTGPAPKTPSVVATLTPSGDKKVAAGETVQLELTVENKGTEPLRRLRGWTESENGYLDRREFLFGLVRPGEKKSWATTVKLPRDLGLPARRGDGEAAGRHRRAARHPGDGGGAGGAAPAPVRLWVFHRRRLRGLQRRRSRAGGRVGGGGRRRHQRGHRQGARHLRQHPQRLGHEPLHREGPLQARRDRARRDQDRLLPPGAQEGLQGRHLRGEAGRLRRTAAGVHGRQAGGAGGPGRHPGRGDGAAQGHGAAGRSRRALRRRRPAGPQPGAPAQGRGAQ